ncbi:hypothetical protein [Deminuibacter soli]|nr:hypothetical protein [Deminuibacter soli]
MNQRIVFAAFLLCINLAGRAQTALSGVQYSQALLVKPEGVFILGKTFKNSNGACFATVKKFDAALKEQWSLRIDSLPINVFSQMAFAGDTLLVTGVHATNTGNAASGVQVLRYINTGGKTLKTVSLGAATADVCGTIATGNNRTAIAYLYNNGAQATEQASKSVIKTTVSYGGKLQTFAFTWTSVLPFYTFYGNNKIYVLGNYNKEYTSMTQPFLQRQDIATGKQLEKIIATREDEFLASAWFREQFIHIITLSNPFNTDESQYVKITAITLDGVITGSVKIPFMRYHWEWAGHDNVYADATAIYLLVRKDTDPAATWLAKLDYTGKLLHEWRLPAQDNYFQYTVYKGELFFIGVPVNTAVAAGSLPVPVLQKFKLGE